MDKIFEQLAKILPPPFLIGLLALGITFFARYYAQGYRAYGDVLQDSFLRNAAVVIAAAAVLFWLNSGSRIRPVSNPVLVIPFFVNDEHDQYRIALSSQIEERLNGVFRRNNTIFKLPSFLNDEETAKQIAHRYGSAAVVYAATVVETNKDSRSACFKLLKVEPEVYKTYSLVPISITGVQLDEIIATLGGSQAPREEPARDTAQTNELLFRVASLEDELRTLQTKLVKARSGEVGESLKTTETPKTHVERRSVLVGLDGARDSRLPQLMSVKSDVLRMSQVLGNFGFMSTILTGDASTRSGIINAIAKMKSNLTSDDLLILYFSGHTTVTAAGSLQVLQLLPSDFDPNAPSTALSINDLIEAVARNNKSNVLLILDGCFGASGLDRNLPRQVGNQGTFVILTGSGDSEVSAETSGGSIFTHALVESMGDLGTNEAAPVLVSNLVRRVSALVQLQTRSVGVVQHPQWIMLSGSDLELRESVDASKPKE